MEGDLLNHDMYEVLCQGLFGKYKEMDWHFVNHLERYYKGRKFKLLRVSHYNHGSFYYVIRQLEFELCFTRSHKEYTNPHAYRYTKWEDNWAITRFHISDLPKPVRELRGRKGRFQCHRPKKELTSYGMIEVYLNDPYQVTDDD